MVGVGGPDKRDFDSKSRNFDQLKLLLSVCASLVTVRLYVKYTCNPISSLNIGGRNQEGGSVLFKRECRILFSEEREQERTEVEKQPLVLV